MACVHHHADTTSDRIWGWSSCEATCREMLLPVPQVLQSHKVDKMSSKYEESLTSSAAVPAQSASTQAVPLPLPLAPPTRKFQPTLLDWASQLEYSLLQPTFAASLDSLLNKDICRLLGIPDAHSAHSSEEGKWSALLLDTVPTPDTIVTTVTPATASSAKRCPPHRSHSQVHSYTKSLSSISMSNDTLELLAPGDSQYENTLYLRRRPPPQSARSPMRLNLNPYLLLEGHEQVPAKYSQFILRQLGSRDLLADLDRLSGFTDSESTGGSLLLPNTAIMNTDNTVSDIYGGTQSGSNHARKARHAHHNSDTGSQVTIFSTREHHLAMRRSQKVRPSNSIKSMTRSDGILDLKAYSKKQLPRLPQGREPDSDGLGDKRLSRSKAIRNKSGGYLYRLKLRILRLATKLKKIKFYNFKVKSKTKASIKPSGNKQKPKIIQLTKVRPPSSSHPRPTPQDRGLVTKISNMAQVKQLLNNQNSPPVHQTVPETIVHPPSSNSVHHPYHAQQRESHRLSTGANNNNNTLTLNPQIASKVRNSSNKDFKNSRLMNMSPSYERFADMYELSRNKNRQNLLRFQHEQRFQALEWDFVQLWQNYLFYVFCKRIQLRFEISQFKQFLSMEYARMRMASNPVTERSGTMLSKTSSYKDTDDAMSISSLATTNTKTTIDSADARFKKNFNRRSMLGEMLDYDSDVDTDTASATTIGSQSYTSNSVVNHQYGAINRRREYGESSIVLGSA